jgi:eukaryotic-like serine/threonine-protein kinase
VTTHVGGGHEPTPGPTAGVPGVMTFRSPNPGDMLSSRYRLEEQVNTDAAGRQIWRGIDMVLRRPVAIVLRSPGGDAAGMLTAAVAVSRVVHPHLASVYDAIDDGQWVYVVREWVPGISLRDIVAETPLGAEHATMVAHAVAEAVSALHAAGIVHGNIHPGTVLVADDGRVVLADIRADASASAESDVRAVGGILYFCLTGHWPHAEAGTRALPDAARDGAGHLAALHQVRAGIPRHLDAMASDLLDPRIEPPAAASLATEFARLVNQGAEGYEEPGPIGFDVTETVDPRRRSGGKLVLGVAVLLVIAAAGVVIGTKVFKSTGAETPGQPTSSGSSPSAAPVASGEPLALRADQLRVVDPPKGDRTELAGVAKTIDGNESTGWQSQHYKQAAFGGLKPGMGILINLGQPTAVSAVKVTLNAAGASAALLTGPNDPGNTSAGDELIGQWAAPGSKFHAIGQPVTDHPGTNLVFPVDDKVKVQILIVWISKLPPDGDKQFQVGIREITVLS